MFFHYVQILFILKIMWMFHFFNISKNETMQTFTWELKVWNLFIWEDSPLMQRLELHNDVLIFGEYLCSCVVNHIELQSVVSSEVNHLFILQHFNLNQIIWGLCILMLTLLTNTLKWSRTDNGIRSFIDFCPYNKYPAMCLLEKIQCNAMLDYLFVE